MAGAPDGGVSARGPAPTLPLTALWLCRHGETPWNAEGRLQGQCEAAPGLTEAGRRQAASLGAALAGAAPRPAAVFSSDLARAAETATIVAMALGVADGPVLMPGLRERDLGILTGLLRARAAATLPTAYAALASGAAIEGGGESAAGLAARVRVALAAVAESAGPGACAAVVSHGGAIAAARGLASGRGVKGRVGNCEGGLIFVSAGGRLTAGPRGLPGVGVGGDADAAGGAGGG